VARLLLVVTARYPTSKIVQQDEALTVKAWHMTLADVPYEAAERALAQWFKSEKWAPDPSELRSVVAGEILGLPEVEEAWGIARGAISAYYPGFNVKLDMPDPVRQAINSIGGLHALKMSERPDKDRDAFMRAYAIERKRAVEMAVLDRPAIDEPRLKVLG
jgi:hypothetical protein